MNLAKGNLMSNQPDQPQEQLSAEEAYNKVTDTITGVNIRKGDNIFQAVTVLICALLGAGLLGLFYGTLLAVLAGVALGMTVGVFFSGFVLMVYRGVRHLNGRHG